MAKLLNWEGCTYKRLTYFEIGYFYNAVLIHNSYNLFEIGYIYNAVRF